MRPDGSEASQKLVEFLRTLPLHLGLQLSDGKNKYCVSFSAKIGAVVVRMVESEEEPSPNHKPCLLLNYAHSEVMAAKLQPFVAVCTLQEAFVGQIADTALQESADWLLQARGMDENGCWTQLANCPASRVIAWQSLFSALQAHLSYCSALFPLLKLLKLPVFEAKPVAKVIQDKSGERLPYGMRNPNVELYPGLPNRDKGPRFGGADGE